MIMDTPCWFLLTLLGIFPNFYFVQTQDQRGYISLDCGLPAELSPYNERSTGLRFLSDEKFIKTGKNGEVQTTLEYLKPHTTLRYFPDGIRNCYSLSVEKDIKYVIRGTFVYGNYDGLNANPQFDMHLGPNPWTTIDLKKWENGTIAEILHTPTSNSLQVCLVKNGTTTPMISALELRPLQNNSYVTESGSLKVFSRLFFNKAVKYLRYPADIHDRRWSSFSKESWSQISTNLSVDNNNVNFPPKMALINAATPTNYSEPLIMDWRSAPGELFYVVCHFAELQDFDTIDTREFDIFLNGNSVGKDLVPSKLKLLTWQTVTPWTCDGGKCILELVRTLRSTLPPILNALEVFTVIQLPQSKTNENDVVAIKSVEAIYGLSRINWQGDGDPCVPHEFAWDGLNCSNIDKSTPPRIISLNLSSSELNGTIAAGIQNFTQLEILDLSNNNLIGGVPEFLGNMKSLLFINLSGNDLNGSIPQSLQRKGLKLFLEANPRLSPSVSPTKPPNKKFPVTIVAIVASVAILIVVLIIIFLVLKKKKPLSVEGNVTNDNSPESSKRRFTYSEVMEMTNNFQRILGEGGFGVVCHGILNGSKHVAIKVLSQSSTQGYKQFKAEVDLLMRVHHINLVSLVGYCDDGEHLALIYEFLSNGDLSQHLAGKGFGPVLNWHRRLKIAVEAALGLEYLHYGCTPPMIHRDVKSTNILLDEQFKAKIGDFGLTRSFPVGGESRVSTMIVGTPGYLDPQYYSSSRLGEKSDVYSFGIVLLEMITNQPVIDQTREKQHISQWVSFELTRGDITKIMDPNLQGDYDLQSAWRVLELALSCTNPSSTIRPDMSQIVTELKECIVSENSRKHMDGGMDFRASDEVSFDTGMLPVAR